MITAVDPEGGHLAPLSHAYARAWAAHLGYPNEHLGAYDILTFRPKGRAAGVRVQGARSAILVRSPRGAITVTLEEDPSPEDYGYPAPAVGVRADVARWQSAELEAMLAAVDGLPHADLIVAAIREATTSDEERFRRERERADAIQK